MRLAISNIAWDVSEDEAVSQLLQKYGVDAIDVAPGKYFPNPSQATAQEIAAVKAWWYKRGIEVTGMQALLFGTSGLNVFGTPDVQTALLDHLAAVCRIGGELVAPLLVFGSPKNRDRTGLSDQQTMDIAVSFFQRLGDIAAKHGVIVCLEPNPPCYGANFMTTSRETAAVVRSINHPAIKMQLDTGAVTINNEDVESVLTECADIIGHIHASEPNLVPLGNGGTDHKRMSAAITNTLPDHLVTIEMVATKDEPHLQAIERVLEIAVEAYSEPSHFSMEPE